MRVDKKLRKILKKYFQFPEVWLIIYLIIFIPCYFLTKTPPPNLNPYKTVLIIFIPSNLNPYKTVLTGNDEDNKALNGQDIGRDDNK